MIETTLLVHPNVLGEFAAYNQFLDLADGLLAQMNLEGVFQIASFHPDYQFAGTSPGDAENYTNRSPYPTLHILREASLARAIDATPDIDEVPTRNIAKMKSLSAEQLRKLIQELSRRGRNLDIHSATGTGLYTSRSRCRSDVALGPELRPSPVFGRAHAVATDPDRLCADLHIPGRFGADYLRRTRSHAGRRELDCPEHRSTLPKGPLFAASLVSVLVGGGSTLVLITQGVLGLDPWYQPSFMIPLAGMIFSASMTNISLALERLHAELNNGVEFDSARDIAFRASMIPVINSFFAVGLISLPGMMTGQILSGVSPLIAARYQIMVMCMIFGAAGLSTICFLVMMRGHKYFANGSAQYNDRTSRHSP